MPEKYVRLWNVMGSQGEEERSRVGGPREIKGKRGGEEKLPKRKGTKLAKLAKKRIKLWLCVELLEEESEAIVEGGQINRHWEEPNETWKHVCPCAKLVDIIFLAKQSERNCAKTSGDYWTKRESFLRDQSKLDQLAARKKRENNLASV